MPMTNAEVRRHLIDLVASQEAIVFVGAGCSLCLGYPDWPMLLDGLRNLANGYDGGPELQGIDEPLEQAQVLKDYIVDKADIERYYQFLSSQFELRAKRYDEFHISLLKLPFRGIITTNYDLVLEAALGNIEPENSTANGFTLHDVASSYVAHFFSSLLDPDVGVDVDPLSLTPLIVDNWRGHTAVDTKIRAKGVNAYQENATTASSNSPQPE